MAIVVLVTWFVQLLGPLFNLPDVVQQLALTNHYGQTMVGVLGLARRRVVVRLGDRRHRGRGRWRSPGGTFEPDPGATMVASLV